MYTYEEYEQHLAAEAEHARIHHMLESHDRDTLKVFWGFVVFWTLFAIATATAFYIYVWPTVVKVWEFLSPLWS